MVKLCEVVLAGTSVLSAASYAPEHRRAITLFLDKQETTMTTTKIINNTAISLVTIYLVLVWAWKLGDIVFQYL
jgi:hypothetical protein